MLCILKQLRPIIHTCKASSPSEKNLNDILFNSISLYDSNIHPTFLEVRCVIFSLISLLFKYVHNGLWSSSSSSSSSVFTLRLLSLIITSSLYSEATSPANLHSLRTKRERGYEDPSESHFSASEIRGGGGAGHSHPEVCCKDLYSDWSWNCLSQ